VIGPCGIGGEVPARLRTPTELTKLWVSGVKKLHYILADESNKPCRAFSSCLSQVG